MLCELHAHTTWSDGSLSVRELVDPYGGRGFDVLCVSDHTVRSDDPWRHSEWPARDVRREVHAPYVAGILHEATRVAHRFELLNRTTLFSWVARAGLPAVANGDFHRPEHLDGWKTLLPCEKDLDAIVAYRRSARPAYLTRIEDTQALPVAA